ncbi:hypothetical protein HK098_006739 [Nowakowskiella sp. JEL0407]|nr:hypothetical protein HK098_006739 [Nowakowskiella sp. JEL0407]
MYSKYTPLLQSMGEDPGEKLFRYAKGMFEFDDPTLEDAIAGVHLAIYSAITNKRKSVLFYSSAVADMFRALKINVDPDELERDHIEKFSRIEKEVRRRLFWAMKLLGNFPNNAMRKLLKDAQVRTPLAYPDFEVLTDENCISLYRSLVVPPRLYNVEAIAQGLSVLKDRCANFHLGIVTKNPRHWDIYQLMIESLKIQNEIKNWITFQPAWFRNVLSSDNIHVGLMLPTDPSKIPWLAPNLHVLLHSLPILTMRFVFALHSSKFVETTEYNFQLSENDRIVIDSFIELTLSECWSCHVQVMDAIRNCIMKLDPKREQVYPVILFGSIHCAIFTCLMSDFAPTPEQRRQSRHDFEYLKQLLSDNMEKWGMARTILQDLIRFDQTPLGDLKIRMSQRMWVNGVGSFDDYVDEVGYYEDDRTAIA